MKSDLFIKWDIYARDDRSFKRFCKKHVGVGFEVFIETVVMLRKNDGKAIPLNEAVEDLCDTTGLNEEDISLALKDACTEELFKLTEKGEIYSERVLRDIEENMERSQKNKENVNKRWEKYRERKARKSRGNTSVEPSNNDCNTSVEPSNYSQRVGRNSRKEKEQENNKKILTVSNEPASTKEKCEDKPASRPGNGMPEIVLKDGTLWTPPETYIVTKQKAYPAVDVMAELWKMAGKTSQRPQSRPLPFNLDGFVNGWLDNAVRDMDRPRACDPDRRIVTDHEERMKGVNPDGTYTI